MAKIGDIWMKNANRRGDIKGYPKLRSMIYTRARRLTGPKAIKATEEELFKMCELSGPISALRST
jgi:hypothetical protein